MDGTIKSSSGIGHIHQYQFKIFFYTIPPCWFFLVQQVSELELFEHIRHNNTWKKGLKIYMFLTSGVNNIITWTSRNERGLIYINQRETDINLHFILHLYRTVFLLFMNVAVENFCRHRAIPHPLAWHALFQVNFYADHPVSLNT